MKVLNPANEEAAIIERLQHDRSTRNHLIPCEIVRSDPTLLVMPSVPDIDGPIRRAESPLMKFCTILKVFHQIAEVRSIHTSHVPVCSHTGDRVSITYILSTSHTSYAPFHFLRALLTVVRTPQDLCFGNVLAAGDKTEKEHPQTKAGRVYIIDFDRSRQLERGPGRQPAIELPSTQYKPPLQMKAFDPYSWDVYCMGRLFQKLTKVNLPSLTFGGRHTSSRLE